jgi:anti-sigma regulatory factor (Ser/Thr protein kinase)
VVTRPFFARIEGVTALRGLRHDLGDWLTEVGAASDTVSDVVLAATELATNGIEASPRSEAVVDAEASRDRLHLTVTNDGPPFAGSAGPRDDHLRPRGRGLAIVAAVTDTLEYRRTTGDCTAVVVTKRLAAGS